MKAVINKQTGEITKVCSHCKRELTTDHFSKSARDSDGLQHSCKECSREMAKASYRRKKGNIVTPDGRTLKPINLSGVSTESLQKEIAKRKDFDLKQMCSPRDMMNALYDLGYRGQLSFVQTITINLSHE